MVTPDVCFFVVGTAGRLSSAHMLLRRIVNDSGNVYIDDAAVEHIAWDSHVVGGYGLIAVSTALAVSTRHLWV